METKPVNQQTNEKKDFKYPLSQAVKNAFTGAKVEGYNPESKMIEVKMADASYHKLKVSDQSATYLAQNTDMPKLPIKETKGQSFELGRTFIELAPDAVKFLNSKYQEKNIAIPETLKINKITEVHLNPGQRKDLGSGQPVNVGPIGEGKDKKDTILMLNPNEPGKLLVMKATGNSINITESPAVKNEQKSPDAPVKAEPRKMREETVAKGQQV